MQNNFCTIVTKNYLMYGLGIYASLVRQKIDFHLYLFAFDDYTADVVKKMNLPHLTVITLAEFLDPDLERAWQDRTMTERCWTSSSSITLYCMRVYKLAWCTSLDADMFFFNTPKIFFDEMGPASILITEHGYADDKKHDALARGIYCVQFMAFRNNELGQKTLNWWRVRCLEWCYNRLEPGKFGDQKYLDDWPTRFEGVHELRHQGGIASWNASRYSFFRQDGTVMGTDLKTGANFPVVFYHFHNAKLFNLFGRVYVKGVTQNKNTLKMLYAPYADALTEMLTLVRKVDPTFNAGFGKNTELFAITLKSWIPVPLKKAIKKLIMRP